MRQILRPSAERGYFDHGWLKTFHTFSFGEYFDAQWNQFRTLRVMNEDFVAPGNGFGMHGHRDMEILTWVLEGELEHRDSLGHGEVLRPGEMQWMSAGSGIRHSEFNPSETTATHLYQIWLLPDRAGHSPTYEQTSFARDGRQNRWQTLAAADGRNGALPIRQSTVVSVAELAAGTRIDLPVSADRAAWVQVLRGEIDFHQRLFQSGDGIGLVEPDTVSLQAKTASEVLVFDLA
ncbi:pirin family protein [bacterium]|nr:pirin family protein [bacterium]